MKIVHPFERVKEKYLKSSNVYKYLILGTFPSIKTKESNFFYGNPKNEFWTILGKMYGVDFKDMTPQEKEKWLDKHGIALYDIIDSYEGDIWYSNDKDLFSLGTKHQYCLEFVRKFLEKHPQAKILGTSRVVQRRFYGQFHGKSFKKTEKKEVHYYFKEIEMHYLPSPSPRNKKITGEERFKSWKNAFGLHLEKNN